MPGVHKTLHRIAARLRFGMNVKGLDWAARGERDRDCDTRSQFVLLNVNMM